MFELSVACKYLIPHRRQLSVSIISLVSTLVIALVVWLIVVFFSVKDGLENGWINKIVALTAPIRITPTKEYYQSYYYLVDTVSHDSQYKNKSIAEKLDSQHADPYDPAVDEELNAAWPSPILNEDGSLKDLVKTAVAGIHLIQKNLNVSAFETVAAKLYLKLLRPIEVGTSINKQDNFLDQSFTEQHLEHSSYIGSIEGKNKILSTMLLPPSIKDLNNLQLIGGMQSSKHLPLIAIPSQDSQTILLNDDPIFGRAILIPQSFKEVGILIGDQGYVSYESLTSSSIQEQQIPVFVAGFYDPGIMPIGNKYLLANKELVSAIHGSIDPSQVLMSHGINVRFEPLSDAPRLKKLILKEFENQKIAPFWHVETYQDYDFTKDLIQQLQSEKNLFSMISLIIIIVACSNIISMLIILVNDKKLEIGILRSMGASSLSIATIFGLCGMTMGTAGSLIGTLAAVLTLTYINELVGFITMLQGHELFNPIFYGSILPSDLSMDSLLLVILATAGLSLLAGVVPAIKASLLKPSAILKAE